MANAFLRCAVANESETNGEDAGRTDALNKSSDTHNPIPLGEHQEKLGKGQGRQREYQWDLAVLETFRIGSKRGSGNYDSRGVCEQEPPNATRDIPVPHLFQFEWYNRNDD